ncbi:MAG: hypothetical protein QNJ63_15850 [Calothrix sp. MO_192.B10]|nr:hypothetical protein [Calothrix sp. MO_192.B10]
MPTTVSKYTFFLTNKQLDDDIYVDTKQNKVPADIWEPRFE